MQSTVDPIDNAARMRLAQIIGRIGAAKEINTFRSRAMGNAAPLAKVNFLAVEKRVFDADYKRSNDARVIRRALWRSSASVDAMPATRWLYALRKRGGAYARVSHD